MDAQGSRWTKLSGQNVAIKLKLTSTCKLYGFKFRIINRSLVSEPCLFISLYSARRVLPTRRPPTPLPRGRCAPSPRQLSQEVGNCTPHSSLLALPRSQAKRCRRGWACCPPNLGMLPSQPWHAALLTLACGRRVAFVACRANWLPRAMAELSRQFCVCGLRVGGWRDHQQLAASCASANGAHAVPRRQP